MRPAKQKSLEREHFRVARLRQLIVQCADPKWLMSIRFDEIFCRVAKYTQEKFVAHVEGDILQRPAVHPTAASSRGALEGEILANPGLSSEVRGAPEVLRGAADVPS